MVGQDLVAPSVPGNGHAASHCHRTGSPGWVSDHGGGSDAAVVGHLPRDPACSVQTSNPGAAREHDRGFLPSDTNPPARRCAGATAPQPFPPPAPLLPPSQGSTELLLVLSRPTAEPNAPSSKGSAPGHSAEAPAVCYGGLMGRGSTPVPGGGWQPPALPPTATKPRKVAGISSVCSLWVCLSVIPASEKSQVLCRAREKVLVNKCVTAEVLLGSAAAG